MNDMLVKIKNEIYDPFSFELSHFKNEVESQEYNACRFKINGFNIICRNAKITPKKVGQFVTFWKREENGPIAPFNETDTFDFFVVNVQCNASFGQFVFPKTILVAKGIISTNQKEGKRAFRVYPDWDIVQSKQAKKTQQWQLDYFYKINEKITPLEISKLYSI